MYRNLSIRKLRNLITNLLLLRHGYAFAALVSHERLIEARKAEYYLTLRRS